MEHTEYFCHVQTQENKTKSAIFTTNVIQSLGHRHSAAASTNEKRNEYNVVIKLIIS